MDRLLKEFDFLVLLSKSTDRKYNSLIRSATIEQLRAVVLCVRVCFRFRKVKCDKNLKCVHYPKDYNVLCKNILRKRKTVQKSVLICAAKIARMTFDILQNVLC